MRLLPRSPARAIPTVNPLKPAWSNETYSASGVNLSDRNGSASITEQWRRIGVFCAAKTPEPHNGLGSEVEVVRHLMIGSKAVPYRPMINGQISLLDFLYALYK